MACSNNKNCGLSLTFIGSLIDGKCVINEANVHKMMHSFQLRQQITMSEDHNAFATADATYEGKMLAWTKDALKLWMLDKTISPLLAWLPI